jgi:hypothetical protein
VFNQFLVLNEEPVLFHTLPAGVRSGRPGEKRLRRIETPHVPHGWDAGVFEETTSTLLCGDLFTPPWTAQR